MRPRTRGADRRTRVWPHAIDTAARRLGLREPPLGEIKTACLHDPDRVVELLAAAAGGGRQSGWPDCSMCREQPAPTLVLPLDQAEELFNADAGPEAPQFLDAARRTGRADRRRR